MIDGYVVNVYNVLNYDIDLCLNTNQYKNVITNQYTYQSVNELKLGQQFYGKTYRCRLNGLLINDKTNKKKKHSYTFDIIKQIDRADGWVKCEIVGVDIFNRLLVNISIPAVHFNIKDYLLQDTTMFQEYIK
jgi:hypothetical protein